MLAVSILARYQSCKRYKLLCVTSSFLEEKYEMQMENSS